ncbi:hypothetical protein PQF11_gp43 [Streptococcus phage SW18]|uniref:DUF1372 family protein n=1 Tax=Streptococcus phage SW18 TaxID=2419638 RepID=A0A3S5H1J5_9CAUD|nr:hypothetical protein PQF11_gp43 [Streptococcus phage SW18]AYP29667.1 hypothetical protein SW18_043 [Streptococcus phage SW18]
MEHSLRKKTSKKWYTDSLIAILVVSLVVNVYYVLTVSRRVEAVTIHRVDSVGKVTGKSMVYTLDCGAYGKFLVTKEQYDSVQVGDDIPSYLRGY